METVAAHVQANVALPGTLHTSRFHAILEAEKQSGKVETYVAWILRN